MGKKRFFIGFFNFFFLNLLFSYLLGLFYFPFIKSGIFLSVFPYISNFALIYFVIFLIFLIIAVFTKGYFFWKFFLSVFFALFHVFTLVDVFVFHFFRFHINSLALNVLFTSGGWETLGIGFKVLFLLFVLVSIFFVSEIFIFKLFFEKQKVFIKKAGKIFIILFLFILAEKILYIYADVKNYVAVLENALVFPYGRPVTAKKILSKFGIKPSKKVSIRVKENSSLKYPIKKLKFIKKSNYPNIVIILVDSFRYDMFSKETSPEIYRFAKKALYFANHYSGGNCSRFGVFSIFYGVYGTLWFNFLGERREPILMEELRNLGYEFKIYSASKLTSPEFRQTCFVNVRDEDVLDDFKTKNKVLRDRKIAESFIDFLDKKKNNRPFFAFLFFDCPHGTYSYPPEFEKFKPARNSVNYLEINPTNVNYYFNMYKNAIFYDDWLTGKILKKLEEKGFLKNTIVFISGDHGEEFFEHGFYGHNGAFTQEQTKVPLILYIPDTSGRKIDKLTSHLDIVPTVFEILGCKNPSSDYSHGISLLSRKKRRWVLIASWDRFAIRDDLIYVVPYRNRFAFSQTFDENYKPIERKISGKVLTEVIINTRKLLE